MGRSRGPDCREAARSNEERPGLAAADVAWPPTAEEARALLPVGPEGEGPPPGCRREAAAALWCPPKKPSTSDVRCPCAMQAAAFEPEPSRIDTAKLAEAINARLEAPVTTADYPNLSPEEFPAAVIAHALDQLDFKQKGI